jgi:hypothetical protein
VREPDGYDEVDRRTDKGICPFKNRRCPSREDARCAASSSVVPGLVESERAGIESEVRSGAARACIGWSGGGQGTVDLMVDNVGGVGRDAEDEFGIVFM